MSAFFEASDVRVHFAVAEGMVRAVDGVGFQIRAGQTLAVVGESGCGKSTLARAIAGIEPLKSGEVKLDGEVIQSAGHKSAVGRLRLASQVQMVFQNPDASLNPRMTLASAIAEPLLIHKKASRADVDQRVCDLFSRVGIDPTLRNRYPHELSGGQRQRVSIARALAVEPALLILDEAVSALDVSIQAQILNLLAKLQRELGLTYLFISHDLGVVRQVAEEVAVMYLGEFVEQGPRDTVLDAPKHPYTQALLLAVPKLDVGVRPTKTLHGEVPSPLQPPSGCRFHTRCPHRFEPCPQEVPHDLEVGPSRVRCHLYDPRYREKGRLGWPGWL